MSQSGSDTPLPVLSLQVLVPSSDDAYSPTFPAIALLEIGVDCRPIAHGSDAQTQMDQIVDWFHDLSLHLPELDTLILRSGVCAPWLIATPLQLLAGNAMRITTHDLLSALLAQLASLGTQTLPSTPVTMPPRLLARETVPHLQRVRRLVLAPLASSPGSRLSDVRLSSLGRQDVFDLFAAIKALAALEELSITLGEVDVEMLAGLADAAGCGKLRSLEIDLRLPDHQPEQVEHEIDGDGLLWGTELVSLRDVSPRVHVRRQLIFTTVVSTIFAYHSNLSLPLCPPSLERCSRSLSRTTGRPPREASSSTVTCPTLPPGTRSTSSPRSSRSPDSSGT